MTCSECGFKLTPVHKKCYGYQCPRCKHPVEVDCYGIIH